jgi:hypothetical protein
MAGWGAGRERECPMESGRRDTSTGAAAYPGGRLTTGDRHRPPHPIPSRRLQRCGADPRERGAPPPGPEQQLVENGIRPYRYRGQRRTTVMALLSRAFVNETLWPEFLELQGTLAAYFDTLTDRVIEQALEVKAGEAEETPEAAPALAPQEHQRSLL